MSARTEWAQGVEDFTVEPGEWVDERGSTNDGVALACGPVIIELGTVAQAAARLRELADLIEAAA